MLRRALGNLISNAIHHTQAGGTVRVELSNTTKGETVIMVENPGLDIPPEHLPKLFDRLYRVDPSRHKDGAGLGLAIVKSIVEAHAGRIKLTSAGGMTRFNVILSGH